MNVAIITFLFNWRVKWHSYRFFAIFLIFHSGSLPVCTIVWKPMIFLCRSIPRDFLFLSVSYLRCRNISMLSFPSNLMQQKSPLNFVTFMPKVNIVLLNWRNALLLSLLDLPIFFMPRILSMLNLDLGGTSLLINIEFWDVTSQWVLYSLPLKLLMWKKLATPLVWILISFHFHSMSLLG